MLKNKTIVIDLDGTLLNDEKKISDSDFKGLIELSIKNSIILASGRNYIETMKIVETYNLKNYIKDFIICSNGQEIYSISENRIINSKYIETSEIINIIDVLNRNNVYWYIIDNRNLLCENIAYNCIKYKDNGRYKINILKTKEDLKKIKIKKFILNTSSGENMQNIKQRLRLDYKVDFFKEDRLKEYKGVKYLQNNILPKGINKYTALQYIIEQQRLPKYIIAFGDGINDYEIMSNSNFSICMENSNEIIKSISNCSTLTNNESGISYAVKNLINEELC